MLTPGDDECSKVLEGDAVQLDKDAASKYRAITARANYLSQARTDIQYAVKELSRAMSKPTVGDWERLKRLGRYLVYKPRVSIRFAYQQAPRELSMYMDSDYAGCPKTRKSTSGGLGRYGGHVLKSWSTTQSIVTLSSGEAEYYGLARGASMGLGLRALASDLGIEVGLKLYSDAAAAIEIAMRRGVGKVRHIEVHQLWLQDRISRGDIRIEKVKGVLNPADALTKYLAGPALSQHCDWTHWVTLAGRHQDMPELIQGLAQGYERGKERLESKR